MGRKKCANNTRNNKHILSLIDLTDDISSGSNIQTISETQVIKDHSEILNSDKSFKLNLPPELENYYLSDNKDLINKPA